MSRIFRFTRMSLFIALGIFVAAIPHIAYAASSPKGGILYDFKYLRDGYAPQAPLVADAQGNLYGVTHQGGTGTGCGFGCGTVFELVAPSSPSGTWEKTTLHVFTNGGDGGFPYGGLAIDEAGNLYGTTSTGGDLNNPNCVNGSTRTGCGIVYELSPPVGGGAWTETVLHIFEWGDTDGGEPAAGVVFDKSGNLYGTTERGNMSGNYGMVFELSPSAGGVWTETVLYTFMCANDGGGPEGPLQFDAAGNLYGTATGCGANFGGTVFELNPPIGGAGWSFNTIFAFDISNGASPESSLIFDASGDIFGTTFEGGSKNRGVAFELIPPQPGGEWTELILHNFLGGSDAFPSGFVSDASGNLYGAAGGASENTCGEIYELSNSANGWDQKILFSFSKMRIAQGCIPAASLVYGKWHALYGTTEQGGSTKVCGLGCGTVFGFLPE